MLEPNSEQYVCPSCEESFYPQQKGVKKVLCGEDQICKPPDENYKAPDCKVYYVCSNECAEELESKLSFCTPVSGWKRLMTRIGEVSSESGVASTRVHDLPKDKK